MSMYRTLDVVCVGACPVEDDPGMVAYDVLVGVLAVPRTVVLKAGRFEPGQKYRLHKEREIAEVSSDREKIATPRVPMPLPHGALEATSPHPAAS